MAFVLKSFKQSVNKSIQAVVAEMNAYFTGTPGRVISVDSSRRISSRKSQLLAIRLIYRTGSTAPTYSAYLIQGSAATTFESAFDAFVAANPTIQIQFIARIEEPQERIAIQTQMIVIGTVATVMNYANDPYVIAPVGTIGAGATGTGIPYAADGTALAAVTLKNVGSSSWTAGQRSVALFDQNTNVFYGVAPS